MALTLTIENHKSLPDGGPLSVTVRDKRGIDIGRNQYLDWTLPDPDYFISGKHCEVRYQNGDYLLFDVSTNGTFLNGSHSRMQSPHRLKNGDRLTIGDYIVAVAVDGPPESKGDLAPPADAQREMWDVDADVAPAVDPKEFREASASRPVRSDFLQQAMGSPDLYDLPADAGRVSSFDRQPRLPSGSDFDWAPVVARPDPPREAEPAVPRPRRAIDQTRGNVWDDDITEGEPRPQPIEPHRPISVAPSPAVTEMPSAADTPVDVRPSGSRGPASGGGDFEADFIARFAKGANIAVENLDHRRGLELAEDAGELFRIVVVEMMRLLSARNEAKRLARSASQTVVQARDNNPLKFSPTPDEALSIMLGPPTASYLDARRAMTRGFADLKAHQMRTYSAMQSAMRMIAEELDPATIEKSLAPGGLSEMLSSRKARLWDNYVAAWRARTDRHDNGLVDVFMLYFADCYDRSPEGEA